jgi:hypothetical protein
MPSLWLFWMTHLLLLKKMGLASVDKKKYCSFYTACEETLFAYKDIALPAMKIIAHPLHQTGRGAVALIAKSPGAG